MAKIKNLPKSRKTLQVSPYFPKLWHFWHILLTLDVVLLPGLAPEHEDGDAGCDAAQDHVQQPGLAQVLGHVVDLAAAAPESEAACRESTVKRNVENIVRLTCPHVLGAAAGSMFPIS